MNDPRKVSNFTQAQRDELVAEALGEALQLRNEVAKIGAEMALMPDRLNNVFDHAKGQITEYLEKATNESVDDMNRRFVASIQEEADNAVKPIKDVTYQCLSRLEQSAEKLSSEAVSVHDRVKLCAISAGAASLLSTFLVICVMTFGAGILSLSSDEKRQLQKGQQIEAVWSDLDQQTRDRLNNAMRAQAEQQ